MDERLFPCTKGKPIPAWDWQHRLPIDKPFGPECEDTGTIFRINATWMDVTGQTFREKHELGFAVISAVLGLVFSIAAATLYSARHGSEINFVDFIFYPSFLWFACWCPSFIFRMGRDEFFSLKRHPIRFNRKAQKIYALRRRRFFGSPDDGDVALEIPWNSQSIFCIRKVFSLDDQAYHICHYTLDSFGNVLHAFGIGREWSSYDMRSVLSQWNYWCLYMNQGPDQLPKPQMYFSEKENAFESYSFCAEKYGFKRITFWHILFSPFLVAMTLVRSFSIWTCRNHIWPKSVESVSAIAIGDPYDQPRGPTPVGWAATDRARDYNQWPLKSKCDSANWHGEKDAAKNAELWKQDIPPSLA